ncbi:MAG: polysaccharide deacetylase family protein [Acidimicrobiales bacterium]
MPTIALVDVRRRVLRLAQDALIRSHAIDRLPPRSGATVLMYHSVAPPHLTRYLEGHLPVDEFERHVAFLAAERHVIGISELSDLLAAGEEPPPGTVVITFDDGYRDNLEVAAPILARHGLPAVVYVATTYVGEGETQWADRLHTMVTARTRHRCPRPPTGPSGELGASVDLDDAVAGADVVGAWHRHLLAASYPERAVLLAALAEALEPAHEPPRLTLTWDEVRELATAHPKIEIGVHTANHVDLAAADEATIWDELNTSINAVEKAVGVRPRHQSFPYGRVGTAARRLMAEAGLDTAMGGTGHQRIGAASDRFDLPRLDAGMTFSQLRARTHPSFGSLPGPLTKGL